MPKETWIIASVLTTVLLLGLLGLASWEKKREVEKVRAELADAQAAAAKAQAEVADLKDKLAESQARIQELQKEKDTVVQTHQSLEDEMRAALESKDVTISQLQGKLTVNILDRVMFDSGEADLKPAGAAVLRKVAAILASHPNLKIHVIGHTDNVPIRAAARKPVPQQLGTLHRPRHGRRPFPDRECRRGPAPPGRGGLWRVSPRRRQHHSRRPRPQPPHRHHHSLRRTGWRRHCPGSRTQIPCSCLILRPRQPMPWLIPRPDNGARDSVAQHQRRGEHGTRASWYCRHPLVTEREPSLARSAGQHARSAGKLCLSFRDRGRCEPGTARAPAAVSRCTPQERSAHLTPFLIRTIRISWSQSL